ncbi:GntR family transcriptional regulator [bacterium]|nr:GntR family transcriptional regulator [bacterium]
MIRSGRRAASLMCPFCHAGFMARERVRVCARCGALHHAECLGIHGRCAVHGCKGSSTEDEVEDEWTIQPDDPEPIGDQIAFRILYAIARGVYRPGDKLPTVRDVAARLRVNPNTVSKAYRDLERDGVLVSRRGTGVFVHEDALATATERRQALVLSRFERAAGEALDAGLDAFQIQEVLAVALERAARARGRARELAELPLPETRGREGKDGERTP